MMPRARTRTIEETIASSYRVAECPCGYTSRWRAVMVNGRDLNDVKMCDHCEAPWISRPARLVEVPRTEIELIMQWTTSTHARGES